MAFISKEQVKNIREALKKEFPKYKFSVTNRDFSEVSISLMASDLDFIPIQASEYYLNNIKNGFFPIYKDLETNWEGKTLEVFKKISEIAEGQGWYDNSNAQIDYFDTAYYIDISVGKWDKPYQKI